MREDRIAAWEFILLIGVILVFAGTALAVA